MLSCKEITELATDYLEGTIPWHKRLLVRMHLWMCINCRRYMDQMCEVIRLMRQTPKEPAPSAELVEVLCRQLREKNVD